jgi:hypothetical protein
MTERRGTIHWIKGFPVLLFSLLLVLGCSSIQGLISPSTPTPTPTQTFTPKPTSTPTATPTETPIPVPLAERDLSDIALQASDLPEGFLEFDLPNIELLLDQMEDDLGAVAENVEKGFICLFSSEDDQIFTNLILVFSDSSYARVAFDEMIAETDGDEVDIPLIGEESVGLDDSDDYNISYIVAWRFHEALVALVYSGGDDIDMDEVVRLAEVIQSRMEGG